MGQVIARRLAARGLGVIAVARSAEAVAALAASETNVLPCVCDIASDDSIEVIRAATGRGPVRMVVHGPGVATAGGVLAAPTAYAAVAGVCNAALANLIRQLSWAYGPRGVTAHLIAPGPADTDRLRRVAVSRGERDGMDADQVLDEMKKESAIGVFTTVDQIAWAVETLLAPEADALAGGTLFMDAGRRRGLP